MALPLSGHLSEKFLRTRGIIVSKPLPKYATSNPQFSFKYARQGKRVSLLTDNQEPQEATVECDSLCIPAVKKTLKKPKLTKKPHCMSQITSSSGKSGSNIDKMKPNSLSTFNHPISKCRKLPGQSEQLSSFFVNQNNFCQARPSLCNSLSQKKNVVALDCEMVGTERGSALARISIVDSECSIILDEYVRPGQDIVDYRTKYSGISKSHLKDAPSWDVVRPRVTKVLEQAILVGHDLKHDFEVMFLHPQLLGCEIWDTSDIPALRAAAGVTISQKPKLAVLAKTLLGYSIQHTNKGHSSVEDAQACMRIFNKYKHLSFEPRPWSIDSCYFHRVALVNAPQHIRRLLLGHPSTAFILAECFRRGWDLVITIPVVDPTIYLYQRTWKEKLQKCQNFKSLLEEKGEESTCCEVFHLYKPHSRIIQSPFHIFEYKILLAVDDLLHITVSAPVNSICSSDTPVSIIVHQGKKLISKTNHASSGVMVQSLSYHEKDEMVHPGAFGPLSEQSSTASSQLSSSVSPTRMSPTYFPVGSRPCLQSYINERLEQLSPQHGNSFVEPDSCPDKLPKNMDHSCNDFSCDGIPDRGTVSFDSISEMHHFHLEGMCSILLDRLTQLTDICPITFKEFAIGYEPASLDHLYSINDSNVRIDDNKQLVAVTDKNSDDENDKDISNAFSINIPNEKRAKILTQLETDRAYCGDKLFINADQSSGNLSIVMTPLQCRDVGIIGKTSPFWSELAYLITAKVGIQLQISYEATNHHSHELQFIARATVSGLAFPPLYGISAANKKIAKRSVCAVFVAYLKRADVWTDNNLITLCCSYFVQQFKRKNCGITAFHSNNLYRILKPVLGETVSQIVSKKVQQKVDAL